MKNDVIGRDYLYKAYKRTISKQELYTNLFKYPINKKTGYEITHIILALTFVEKTYRIHPGPWGVLELPPLQPGPWAQQ